MKTFKNLFLLPWWCLLVIYLILFLILNRKHWNDLIMWFNFNIDFNDPSSINDADIEYIQDFFKPLFTTINYLGHYFISAIFWLLFLKGYI